MVRSSRFDINKSRILPLDISSKIGTAGANAVKTNVTNTAFNFHPKVKTEKSSMLTSNIIPKTGIKSGCNTNDTIL